MSTVFIYLYPIGTCFFVLQVLVSAFVIGWSSFRNNYVYYMCQNFQRQFSVVVSASLIGQSSSSYFTFLHMYEHLLFYYQRQGVVSFYHKQISVVFSASLIGQSSLIFITVLHMFQQVFFYYQRHGVVTSLSLCLEKKLVCGYLKINLIFISI